MNKLLALLIASLLAACGSDGPPPADWKMNAVSLMEHAQSRWLEGDAKAAELAKMKTREEIAKSGRIDLLARAELAFCAAHAAVLQFKTCSGFEAIAADANIADKTYARFLSSDWGGLEAKLLPTQYQALVGSKEDRAANLAAQEIKDPLARLIALSLLFKQGRIQPQALASAVETASERGWRRPLLAWLEVSRQRALASGDQESAARIARRIGLASTQPGQP